MTTLKEGDKAPKFQAIDQNGKEWKLGDFKGKKLILFFYPADNTPGCTNAACSLSDAYKDLKKKGFEMMGVSPDSAKKHQNFIKKYNFPFNLIVDAEHELMDQFGVWGPKKFMGREYDGVHRTTFIIDEKGKLERVFTKVVTKTHAEQILESYN